MTATMQPEQQVIGSLMLDTRRLPDVAEILTPEQFSNRHHATIYGSILELHDAGEPVDVTTVADRLERTGRLDSVGGLAYIGRLAQHVTATANVLTHARSVADRAIDRALQRAGADISKLVEQDVPPAQKIDLAGEILNTLSRSAESGEIQPITDVVSAAIDEIELRFEAGGKIPGELTGFSAIDERWDGLIPGDLIVLAARPSMGKTALAINIAAHVAQTRPVAVFELEMPGKTLVQRIMSAAGQVPFKKIKRGDLHDYDWPKLTVATAKINKLKLYIDDRAGLTLSQIRTYARKVKRQQRDIGLVVVDYLQIMDDEQKRQDNRSLSLQRITTGLKGLAKELDCAVIVLSQLSRANEQRANKRPRLSDLRESGAIEQDADVVAFIHREDVYRDDDEQPDDLAEIITAKARNTETGTDILEWRGEFQQFMSTDRTPSPQRRKKPEARGIHA